MTTLTRPTLAQRRAAIWASPTRGYDENGLHYVENSEDWKQLCEQLPCFDALEWPGYDAFRVETEIRGEPVVIQLWKGWCQKFLLMSSFPGGIGAEVGVYRRVPGHRQPGSLPFLPPLSRAAIQARMRSDAHVDLWWPAPDLSTELTFSFINPLTDAPVFTAGPQRTYWLTKWMDEFSYAFRYTPSVGLGKIPAVPTHFVLEFGVDGRRWRWLPPGPGDPRRGTVVALDG